MTIKRQILNFNQHTVDVRMGLEIMDELPRLIASAVGKPRRALLVTSDAGVAERTEEVRRALIDAGFAAQTYAPVTSVDVGIASVDAAQGLFGALEEANITNDDLVFALGSYELCSLAAFCARLWRGGCASALMPMGLDGMVLLATEMHPLAAGFVLDAVSFKADPTMVLCDLSLLPVMEREHLLVGYALMVGAAMAEGKKTWTNLCEQAAALASGDELAVKEALSAAQVARRNVLKSPNPSARHALEYGRTAARALASCVESDTPASVLLAEGMRFEARLAVDAAGLDPELVFDQDDLLFDLGIEEASLTFDAEALANAMREVHARYSNRFLLPLPKSAGMIRLTSVSDEILERHAAAYAASLCSE